MSGRETGGGTWARFAAFPEDNLELENAPEEDDVDHRADPPSWVPGTGAVGTGAGPPDLDDSDDEQFDGGPVYAAGPDDSDAPGFADMSAPSGAGYGEAPAEAPDFEGAPADAPPGFGGAAPADGLGFTGGSTHDPVFGDVQADDPVFGGAPPNGPAYGAADAPPYRSAAPGQPGFTGGSPQTDYSAPFTGEFRGDYVNTGFGGAAQEDGGFTAQENAGFGGQENGAVPGGPGPGTMYAGEQAYQAGRENGAQPQHDPAPPFPAQYPPVEPPRSGMTGMTAALRARAPKVSKVPRRKKRDRPGRQAQLTVSRIEPWSVMKFSFVISLVAFIVLFVAVAVLYAVLSGLGVFSALQHTVSNITSSQSSGGFNLQTYLSASRVLGYAGLLGAINVVLITALSTVGAVLYNITADLAGGIEVTLKETE